MGNKQIKCVKKESCLHCGSNYRRFVDELEQIKLLLNNGEIELVNRLLRYNRAINAIEELAKNNDKVKSKEIEKIIKRIEQ